MSPEVYDLLVDSIKEIKTDISSLRTKIETDIANLRDKMQQEHKTLGDRVGRLEHHEKFTRYLFGGGAALITLTLRELIPKIF